MASVFSLVSAWVQHRVGCMVYYQYSYLVFVPLYQGGSRYTSTGYYGMNTAVDSTEMVPLYAT